MLVFLVIVPRSSWNVFKSILGPRSGIFSFESINLNLVLLWQ